MIYGAGFVLVCCEDTEENRSEIKRYIAGTSLRRSR